MGASRFVLAAGFLIAAAVSPVRGVAQEPVQNFELSLLPPVQLRGEDSAIRILRLGLYNRNVSVKGLDVGVVNTAPAEYRRGFSTAWSASSRATSGGGRITCW